MPIREYIAVDSKKSCKHCRDGFEQIEPINTLANTICPQCGNKVKRQISAPSVGASQTGLDDRAKNAGFTKLKKLGDGEYEKQY